MVVKVKAHTRNNPTKKAGTSTKKTTAKKKVLTGNEKASIDHLKQMIEENKKVIAKARKLKKGDRNYELAKRQLPKRIEQNKDYQDRIKRIAGGK